MIFPRFSLISLQITEQCSCHVHSNNFNNFTMNEFHEDRKIPNDFFIDLFSHIGKLRTRHHYRVIDKNVHDSNAAFPPSHFKLKILGNFRLQRPVVARLALREDVYTWFAFDARKVSRETSLRNNRCVEVSCVRFVYFCGVCVWKIIIEEEFISCKWILINW